MQNVMRHAWRIALLVCALGGCTSKRASECKAALATSASASPRGRFTIDAATLDAWLQDEQKAVRASGASDPELLSKFAKKWELDARIVAEYRAYEAVKGGPEAQLALEKRNTNLATLSKLHLAAIDALEQYCR